MFDHYLTHQQPDRKRQRLLSIALFVSTTGTLLSVLFMYIMGKFAIEGVSPPTISYIMVQMSADEPPPPPPPPPPPAAAEEPVEEEVIEEEEPLDEEIIQPKEVKEKIPEVTKKRVSKLRGGGVGGMIGGMPGGSGSMFGGISTKAKGRQSAKKPISAVMEQAIYAPSPDQKLFQSTKTGRFSKTPGATVVSFCIASTGKVVDVRTKRGFPGDPQIDKIVRDQVKKWRFRPFKVAGKAMKTCTDYKFKVKFK